MVKWIGVTVFVPLCLAGTFLGIVLLVKRKLACPLCHRPATFFLNGRTQPGVCCEHCGLVYVRNLLTDFKVRVSGIDEEEYGDS